MKKRKHILILQTGGTIAMKDDLEEGVGFSEPGKGLRLREDMPELERIATFDVRTLFVEDSSNLNHRHWDRIGSYIHEKYNQYDGFVIVHGTDTMAFTASFLSFAFAGLTKPIVLTGSQIPLGNVRSDARRNLINSVEIATTGLCDVGICFNDRFLRGNRSTKMSIGDFDAFASPNYPPIAEIGLNISLKEKIRKNRVELAYDGRCDNKVALIKIFPGLNPAYIEPLQHTDVRCIVLEVFGSGNIPIIDDFNLLPFVESCLSKDILVVVTSQAPYDAVDLSKYLNARLLHDAGAISAGDMTIEATITKMMVLLGRHKDIHLITELFSENLAGERSV
jgi:L-asparaginase